MDTFKMRAIFFHLTLKLYQNVIRLTAGLDFLQQTLQNWSSFYFIASDAPRLEKWVTSANHHVAYNFSIF